MQSNERKEQIANALKKRIESTKQSANKIAVQLGVSSALVSQMLNGHWDKIADKQWHKAETFLGLDGWRIVATANFETVLNVAAHCQQNSLMRTVLGYSGAGKTTALKYYARNKANSFYVLCQVSMSRKDFLAEILETLGVSYTGNAFGMIKRIAKTLNDLENPLLILDDAGKLNDGKLHTIQQIFDLTKDSAGILLSAVDYFYDNLAKGVQRGKMGYPELVTRIGYKQTLAAPTRQEKAAIADANAIGGGDALKEAIRRCSDFRTLENEIVTHNKKEEQR